MSQQRNFVNPYTFAPLPSRVVRQPPLGHTPSEPDKRYSGTITVQYTLASPLLLPAEAGPAGWVDADDRVRIPGSSVKGSVRSLHETLFNGCMRIVNGDFVPGYRDSAVSDELRQEQTGGGDWVLGLVVESTNGKPKSVRPTGPVAWIDSGELAAAYPKPGRLPTSGDILDVEATIATPDSLGRRLVERLGRVSVVHRWAPDRSEDEHRASLVTLKGAIFLATSVGARKSEVQPQGKRGAPPPGNGKCLWAFADLTDRVAKVSEAAQHEFNAAVDGADDRRSLLSNPKYKETPWRDQAVHEPVWWPVNRSKGPVARRALHTGFLWPGDVVWVRTDPHDPTVVTGLRLANLWRHGAVTPVKKRMPADLLPCPHGEGKDRERLCLTCSIFGSADEDSGQGAGHQGSYGAHVRFGSAVSDSAVRRDRVATLTPMGAPKPGAGVFYLAPGPEPRRDRSSGDIASHWDSEADVDAGRRNIAGRKFYWHSEPNRQRDFWRQHTGRPVPARYEASTRQASREGGMKPRKAELVPAGTTFTATVAFDGLDALSLRTLVAAIDPSALLSLVTKDHGQFAVHLGGGKPLGLGSAVPRITAMDASTVRSRYSTSAQRVPDDEFRPWQIAWVHSTKDRVGNFASNLPPLARILDLAGLGSNDVLVTYPPGSPWAAVDSNNFRESFTWFKHNSGRQLAHGKTKSWNPLPRPTEPDQTLPIGELR